MQQNRQEARLLSWLQALPESVFRNRPVLTVHYAGTLLQNGHLDGVEPRLRQAERWLEMPADSREQPIYVDEADFQRLPGSVAMYHAGIALIRGEVANTIRYAEQVLELAPADAQLLRGAATSLLGLAFWTSGDLEKAYQMFAEGMAYLQRVGFISDLIGGSVTLADIRITQGRLREAMDIYKHGLQLATKQTPPLRGAADMHVGMSDLFCEHNDLDSAMQHLMKSNELGEINGLPKNPYRWRVAMARLREAEGDLDGALNLLEEAAPLYVGDFSPNFRPAQALKARVWLAQGKLDEALGWVRQQGLSAEDALSYLREFEHMTLARLLLACWENGRSLNALQEAAALLDRLLNFAEAGGRMGVVIEILVLQARARQLQGDILLRLKPWGVP
jgi:LuxR family maltose regulon positive regulatory protein